MRRRGSAPRRNEPHRWDATPEGGGALTRPGAPLKPKRGFMLRRTIFVKLKPEFATGLEVAKLRRSAATALRAAYGVQGVKTESAADDATRAEWDMCIVVEYVSGVDEKRSASDPIRVAFEQHFLDHRAVRVWSGVFTAD